MKRRRKKNLDAKVEQGLLRSRARQVRVLEERLARSLADYQNLVKRVEREKLEVVRRANKSLIEDLIPVLGVLERAQGHLKDGGLKMAVGQFMEVLEQAGVEKIKVEDGDRFDEREHEVVETVKGGKKGRVAEVLQDGFRWRDNGEVLRYARVTVYDGEKYSEK